MPQGYHVDFTLDPAWPKNRQAMMNLAARRASARTRDRIKKNITSARRVDTGAMRNSVEYVLKRQSADSVSYEVGVRVFYARWQEEGVKGPIYPRRAKFLRFQPKGKKGFVFAKKVNGFKGAFMVKKALDQLKTSDFR